jgi:putative PIN family toxin of toxin-antitoxin system
MIRQALKSQASLRVVLDNNVVVSTLLFPKGQLAQVRNLWTSGRIQPLVCHETVAELIRVLAYPKFRLSPEDIQIVLAEYLPFTTTVNLPGSRSPVLPPCRDPKDQFFLDLALAGSAEVLVSGDADLLVLAGQVPFAIEAPAVFRQRF